MKNSMTLLWASSLLLAGCSLSSRPAPFIPVTGNTEPAASPTPSVITATPTPVHGTALAFDGQDDYVLVADDPSLDLTTGLTIAAWIYLDEYTGWASFVTKGDKPNVNNYAVQQSEPFDPRYGTQFGRLRFTGCFSQPTPLPESGTVLSLKTWHFVALTFDGLQVHFYTDGQLDGSSPVAGPLCTNNAPLYIGVDFPLTTEYWHGAIDELMIWNVPLSDQQIRDLMNGAQPAADSSLVGYWPFDEGAGSLANDHSSYGNNGQLMGNPTWLQTTLPIHYP
jgi:hypothetical protein